MYDNYCFKCNRKRDEKQNCDCPATKQDLQVIADEMQSVMRTMFAMIEQCGASIPAARAKPIPWRDLETDPPGPLRDNFMGLNALGPVLIPRSRLDSPHPYTHWLPLPEYLDILSGKRTN